METFNGTIIEESLEDKSILDKLKIVSTKIEPITDRHQTPWVAQWTLHKVEIESNKAVSVAEELSKVIDHSHKSSWYADFKNEDTHYIIFRDKVFKIDRTNIEEYAEATKYGLTLGIPDYQLGFVKFLKNKLNND
jgi:hypothetical protein